ncbi:hypothetical protein NQ318_004444, partial [Aromia moschata]
MLSGWITEDLFTEWVKHFAKFTKPNKDDPILLVMDKHSTHSNLATYNFCRNTGIKVVSIPPHTPHTGFSHSIFILQTDIAELFKNAYNRVATVEKGVKAFQVTGIFPFNRFVFSDDEFTHIPAVEIPSCTQNFTLADTEAVSNSNADSKGNLEKTPSPVPGPSSSGPPLPMSGQFVHKYKSERL